MKTVLESFPLYSRLILHKTKSTKLSKQFEKVTTQTHFLKIPINLFSMIRSNLSL